ncbi:MAG: hypothetical protein KUG62_08180, partial [Rhodobacteraceae bacterium]|nr:hypothetical protein [Paracoccaceae bacterium]
VELNHFTVPVAISVVLIDISVRSIRQRGVVGLDRMTVRRVGEPVVEKEKRLHGPFKGLPNNFQVRTQVTQNQIANTEGNRMART